MKVYSEHCSQNIVNINKTQYKQANVSYNVTSWSTIVVFWLADTQRVVGPMANGVHNIKFYSDLSNP